MKPAALMILLALIMPGGVFAPPWGSQLAGISEATPRKLVWEVCRRESHLEWASIGDKGASYGPCQIKPATAREAGFDGHDADLMHPAKAARAAAAILLMYRRQCGSWAAAIECYKHGPSKAIVRGRKCVDYPKSHPVRWICVAWELMEVER